MDQDRSSGIPEEIVSPAPTPDTSGDDGEPAWQPPKIATGMAVAMLVASIAIVVGSLLVWYDVQVGPARFVGRSGLRSGTPLWTGLLGLLIAVRAGKALQRKAAGQEKTFMLPVLSALVILLAIG